MKKGKPIEESDWKDGFLFVGNELILDFLNTRPVQNGEFAEFIPDFNALVKWSLAAGVVGSREAAQLKEEWGGSARAQRAVQALRELREKLRKAIIEWERSGAVSRSMVAEINQLMLEHPMLTRLKVEGSGGATELWFKPRQPEDFFAPLTYSAAALFANANPSRVRKCGQCVLHFHDTSKKGTRRWCSMQMCGNRVKVAAYAARKRGGSRD